MRKNRPVCVSCNKKLTPWGKTKSGKKRYGCNWCRKTRVYKKTKLVNTLDLFKQYVLWGLTYEMLSSITGFSPRYLESEFHKLFRLDPPHLPRIDQSKFDEAYLLIDGLWFGRWFVLLVYRQSGNLHLLHVSIAEKEATTKIERDLIYIKNGLKYVFTGAVTDGGTGILSALTLVYSHMPHQICLAHMHRRIVSSLGRYSRDERIRALRWLADWVWMIESKSALSWWNKELKNWIYQNIIYLRESHKDETGRTWFVHSGVRKAVRMLVKLPKTSFVFLDHPTMPKTTNELEATFGHLGQRWLRHKGLKRERWESFLKWFTYFYNKEKMDR